jgi:phosphatidate cytidylyltransferase
MTAPLPKTGDLGVRVTSAVVMVAVAGTALWLGGWVWAAFVAAVALGVLWEWWSLVQGFVAGRVGRGGWLVGGIVYIGLAAMILILARSLGPAIVLLPLLAVIATDIGAYFAGRAIGGPKIAPRISPSKTWAGLAGGAIAAGLVLVLWASLSGSPAAVTILPLYLAAGGGIAVVAQAGDFFESWMKRKAGVKDSGHLIPGHGGLFDRVDGLVAVGFMMGLVMLLIIGGTVLSGGSLLPSPA